MQKLGIMQSFAIGILTQTGPLHLGRMANWAKRKLNPVWEEEARHLQNTLQEKVKNNPRFQGRKATITTWAEISVSGMEMKGIIETGPSFEGITSGMFAPFKRSVDVEV